jgi:hypothetical protein
MFMPLGSYSSATLAKDRNRGKADFATRGTKSFSALLCAHQPAAVAKCCFTRRPQRNKREDREGEKGSGKQFRFAAFISWNKIL